MNIAGIGAIILALTLGLTGCGGSVEGTYRLDKQEVKKAVQAELAGQSGGGLVFDFFTRMIDEVEMKMELQAGGKASVTSTLPTGGYAGPRQLKFVSMEDKEGTWKTDGESIVITAGGNLLTCSRSQARLSCQPDRKVFFPLLFVKF
jgi:hypothetical protein